MIQWFKQFKALRRKVVEPTFGAKRKLSTTTTLCVWNTALPAIKSHTTQSIFGAKNTSALLASVSTARVRETVSDRTRVTNSTKRHIKERSR